MAAYNDNTPMYGVIQGVYYGQNERVEELNERSIRYKLPEQELPPNFDPRPVPTKYARLPCIDRRTISNVPIVPNTSYTPESVFTPPVYRSGPPNTFLARIDTDSILRNQTVAYQRGADQGVYVPSSHSDLYKVTVDPGKPVNQDYPLLFARPQFSQELHPNLVAAPQIGRDRFMNNTRVQLRSMV
jgi:hypothetical protein